MFDNYNNTNLNTSFTPPSCNVSQPSLIQKPQPIIPNNPNKPYEIESNGVLKGYFWYYGNSIDLTWDITGEYTSEESASYAEVKDIIDSCNIVATIYDWKYQVIDKIKLIPIISEESVSVTLNIKGDLSNKLVRGNYTISLTLMNDQGYNETLFSTDTCKFEVR